MPKSSTKTPTIQTPGMEPSGGTGDGLEDPGQDAKTENPNALPSDVAALVAEEVDRRLARMEAARLRAQANPAGEELPTQEEAMAKVMADPKHRSVLSKDGWVTFQAPPKELDEHGFAKN